MGSYTAQQGSIDNHKLLYNATNLQDGYTHNLTFTNADNQTFAFDYAIIEESIYDNIAKLHLALTSLPDVVCCPVTTRQNSIVSQHPIPLL